MKTRVLLSVSLVALFAACDPTIDQSGDADAAFCQTGDPPCDPECAGIYNPNYCFAGPLGRQTPCGTCEVVGKSCSGFEWGLVCAADHQWRCTYAPGG